MRSNNVAFRQRERKREEASVCVFVSWMGERGERERVCVRVGVEREKRGIEMERKTKRMRNRER